MGAHVVATRLGVVECVLHRRANSAFHVGRDVGADVGARTDTGQRHRQVRLALPPVAQIDRLVQPVLGVREPALVNDESRVHVTAAHGVQNAIVAHLDHIVELRRGKTEQAIRGGFATGNRHAPTHGIGQRHRRARDDERTHAVPECRATAEQAIAVAHGGESPDAEFGEIELAIVRASVQLFDVEQHRHNAHGRVDEPEREWRTYRWGRASSRR